MPNNLSWSTPRDNTNNRELTWFISYNGRTLPASEWAEEIGVSYQVLWNRHKNGWTDEEALTTPLLLKPDHNKVNTKEWHAYYGMLRRSRENGIDVHQPWRDDIMAFFNDVGDAPDIKARLRRKDLSRGFFPDNVSWCIPGTKVAIE